MDLGELELELAAIRFSLDYTIYHYMLTNVYH